MIFFFWRLTCGSQENAGPDLNRLVNLNSFEANAWNITLGFHPLKAQQCFEGNQIWFCFPYYNLLLGNIRNYFTVTSDCLISTLNTFLGVLNFIISPSTLMVKHFLSRLLRSIHSGVWGMLSVHRRTSSPTTVGMFYLCGFYMTSHTTSFSPAFSFTLLLSAPPC